MLSSILLWFSKIALLFEQAFRVTKDRPPYVVEHFV